MSELSLAILAGGRGERLGGVAKGALLVNGRSCLQRLLDLADLFEEVFLVGPESVAEPTPGLRVVPDLVAGRGAPGGVHAALAQAKTPWVVAVGCDMPFVRREAVERLLAERGEQLDAVCFEVGGRLEPLLGVYRAGAAELWRRALDAEPSFREVFARLRARVLPEAALRAVDPEARSVVSLNTPADLARWGGKPGA